MQNISAHKWLAHLKYNDIITGIDSSSTTQVRQAATVNKDRQFYIPVPLKHTTVHIISDCADYKPSLPNAYTVKSLLNSQMIYTVVIISISEVVERKPVVSWSSCCGKQTKALLQPASTLPVTEYHCHLLSTKSAARDWDNGWGQLRLRLMWFDKFAQSFSTKALWPRDTSITPKSKVQRHKPFGSCHLEFGGMTTCNKTSQHRDDGIRITWHWHSHDTDSTDYLLIIF